MENTGLNNTDVEKIKTLFDLYPEIEKVILYGSRAKGTFKPASDIDLTLVSRIEANKIRRIKRQSLDIIAEVIGEMHAEIFDVSDEE